ncbi:MAG: hypothetical protein AAGA35_01790 [Patescibacteria group bacterium]
MEKFYTLFCATDELHTSPAIQMYSRLHDITLSLGEEQVMSFLLPSYIHSYQHDEVCVLYDPDMVDLNSATVTEQRRGSRVFTNISISLTPRDIGSSTLGFVSPESAEIYSLLASYEPRFISTKNIL